VSSYPFRDASCDQIKTELVNIQRRTIEISEIQNSEATKDALVTGFSLAFFWPGLIFLVGEDRELEFASLRGTYITLEDVALEKNCEYANEIIESRKKLEELKKERDRKQRARMQGEFKIP